MNSDGGNNDSECAASKLPVAPGGIRSVGQRARKFAPPVSGPYECRGTDIPTSWAFDNPPGLIERNNAIFTDVGRTTVDFVFRNRETSPLQSLALVMEYIDAQDEVIDSLTIVATVKPGIQEAPPNILSPSDAWKSALLPGNSARMVGVKDGIRTGRCPVRALITFATIRFLDGTKRVLQSPGWQLPAIPKQVPRLPDTIPEFPAELPATVLARLRISASGGVIGVVSEETVNPSVVAWIRGRMEDWKFHSALVDGKPADSEFTTLFLIHAKGMVKFSEEKPILQPVTLIQFIWSRDLFQQTAARDRWTVMYGLLEEGTVPDYWYATPSP